jgi:hypothetical protein
MAKRWSDPKDPNEVLDYTVDWEQPLEGDTIINSSWTVPIGITGGLQSNTATRATVWLSGGTDGETYTLMNRIVTASGRTRDQTCLIRVSAK